MSRVSADDREFGRRVAEARQWIGLNQTDLGRAAGLPHPQARVSRIELGLSPATVSEAAALARALGVSIDDLLADGLEPAECPRCIRTANALRSLAADLP